MTKAELISCFAKERQLPNRTSERIVKAIFEELEAALVDEQRIEFRGFGSLFVKNYDSYTARNPKNGEQTHVQPRKRVRFRLSDQLLTRINKEFLQYTYS